ncbi:hypothetical protein BMI91_19490 [Thioclava sediminum]|uniref:Uncharacterized protein n=1 Tax=Thioclava sediminum TaxID=1915319 RepID=A0ABX3MRY9_9RHOB|nr:hypothetical protein [Thioclava sediminum]OOY22467.1 hypothetical protein BMI91_19490 [Thioclava sediminum]
MNLKYLAFIRRYLSRCEFIDVFDAFAAAADAKSRVEIAELDAERAREEHKKAEARLDEICISKGLM